MADIYKKALALIVGIDTIEGKGVVGKAGRKALKASASAIIAGGRGAYRIVAPAVARGAPAVGRTLLRRSPYIAGALAGKEIFDRREEIYDDIVNYQPPLPYVDASDFSSLQMAGVKTGSRSTPLSAFNKAVKKGVAILKASSSNGKKGTLKDPKKALSQVSKIASSLNKGKKVTGTGIKKKIVSGIKGFFK